MKRIKKKAFLVLLLLFTGSSVYSQDAAAVEERIVSKTISIDELRKVQYLEDLLDSFPMKDYYVYYCYITRSGKGFVTTTTILENTYPNERRPIINSLFYVPDRPVKQGQKYLFDRIFIRKFKDKNSSEPFHSLELFITN